MIGTCIRVESLGNRWIVFVQAAGGHHERRDWPDEQSAQDYARQLGRAQRPSEVRVNDARGKLIARTLYGEGPS